MRTPEYRVWITAPKEDWLGADDYDTFDWNNRMRMVASMHFPLGSYSGKDITAEAIFEPDYYAEGWLAAEYSYEDTVRPSEFILMEYIGLKDKNGVKIFEGDIVKYYGYDYSEDGDFEYYKVEFTKECYGEKWGWDLVDIKGNAHEYYYGGFNAENCVVIGNIHSNPEILK